jgi:uracil-DNA glycosylase
MELIRAIQECRLCTARFAATATKHAPRPVAWFQRQARVLIAGQAPGARVHDSGRPFTDRSGDRLREWIGLGPEEFYDLNRVAIVPMAFCFPGYDAKGSDLPPPPLCAATWRTRVLAELPDLRLTLLVGGAAMDWHLGRGPVGEKVRDWRVRARQGIWGLPHPSWRNTGCLKMNPWFETELLPELRLAVRKVMDERCD